MKGIFLRSYAILAIVSVLAIFVTHNIIANQMRAALTDRFAELFDTRMELARERVARGENVDTRQLLDLRRERGPRHHERNGPPHDPRFHDNIDIVPIASLPLDEAALERLANGEVVAQRQRRRVIMAAQLDETRAVVVRLERPPVPRPMLVHQGLTLLTLLVVIGVGLWWLQRPIEARLARLAQAASALGSGDRTARSGVSGNDAVGRVGEQFDSMATAVAELIARREELLRSVSHELRTPLARLTLLHEQAAESSDIDEQHRLIERMRRNTDEMTRLVEELLAFARADAAQSKGVVSAVVGDRIRECIDASATNNVTVTFHGGDQRVALDAEAFSRAIGNLLRNAVRHARTRVDITVTTSGEHVFIDVDDDGAGVPVDQRERIFEPFVRLDSRPATDGSGLGLAIARRALESMGATVICLESPLGGARFRVTLPKA